ncbi:S8 family serine peptidase, partial [Haloplanus litoreus]
DSGSYFPSVAGDGARITAAAERAADEGVVFVTSAGNYANRHWAGPGAADGWVSFTGDDAANHLADGDRLQGRVTVRLRWRSDADYDLYLYRRLPNAADRVVAKSAADETGPGRTVESVDVAVPRGRYYVAVYADDVAAATADDPTSATGRVQVFAAHHELEHATARGSMVAPATSDRVVAVGATANGDLAAYSSLSANGTVDLTAPASARTRADPDLAGTSAAAPYVAGTAALMESGSHDPSPERVEAILERTADGEDGAIDALAAVEAATDASADPGAAPTAGTAASDPATSNPAADADGPGNDGGADDAAPTARERSTTDADRNTTRSGGTDGGVRPDESSGADRSADGGRSDDGREGEDEGTDRNDDPDGDRTGEQDDDRNGTDDGSRTGGSTADGDSAGDSTERGDGTRQGDAP